MKPLADGLLHLMLFALMLLAGCAQAPPTDPGHGNLWGRGHPTQPCRRPGKC